MNNPTPTAGWKQATTMTPKLILTLDGAVLKEFILNKPSISIGRRHGNEIQLNDLTVSGRHALVTLSSGEGFIEDLGSTNGTLVNGNYVNKAMLAHGDVVQIGAHQLTYYRDDKVAYEPTMFIRAELEKTQMMPAGKEPAEAPPTKGQPMAAIRVLNGPLANTVMELRKPFNVIGFNGNKMALISRGLRGYSITAVKGVRSRRETDIPVVNGARVESEAQPLKDKDAIQIAGFDMEFFLL